MTWTYDPSDLGTDTASGRRNAVRALIQDIDTDAQQLQDEEILFFLSQVKDDVYAAAAQSCETLAARYARYGDTALDGNGISVNFKDVAEAYRATAARMRQESRRYGGAGLGVPKAGGLSKSQVEAVRSTTDRVQSTFSKGQFRNPSDGYDGDERKR